MAYPKFRWCFTPGLMAPHLRCFDLFCRAGLLTPPGFHLFYALTYRNALAGSATPPYSSVISIVLALGPTFYRWWTDIWEASGLTQGVGR